MLYEYRAFIIIEIPGVLFSHRYNDQNLKLLEVFFRYFQEFDVDEWTKKQSFFLKKILSQIKI